MKQNFKGEFLITKEVKKEIIDHPKTVKRFKLGAIRLEQLYNKGVFKLADINQEEVNELRRLRDEIQEKLDIKLPFLSMGMSGDFKDAITEGSTHIRVGTSIFGKR